MSLSHLLANNSYHATGTGLEQSIIILAVDRNQLSVLLSISTVGKMANDPLSENKDAQGQKQSQTTPLTQSEL